MVPEDPVLARLIDRVRQAGDDRRPLDIRGGGSKLFFGEPPRGDPLDMRGLTGISSYEPTELVVTVRAGTRLAELEAALEESGQCLPFEPPRFSPGGTVGGMVAAGISGPTRVQAGSVRDHVLGVTLLSGRAELLTFGGQVAKNVAGYDVSRVIAGSWGILGVICEVSLKVLPKNRATATVCFECDELEGLQRLDGWASRALPINASAWCGGTLYVRLSGARAAVEAACAALRGMPLGEVEAATWWQSVRDQTGDFFSMGEEELARGECLWRLSVPPRSGALKLPGTQLIEWHGAQRWWRTAAGTSKMRSAASALGGHATLVRGNDKSQGVFTPVSEALIRIHKRMKQAFDPFGILNPGRLYPGL